MTQLHARLRPWTREALRFLLVVLVASACCMDRAAGAGLPELNVPAGSAAKTLQIFARQAGVQLVYPADEVRGYRTRPVRGSMAPRQALETMLADTGLAIVEDSGTGAFVVKRSTVTPALEKPEGAGAPSRRGHATADSPSSRAGEDQEIVLSPFEVRTQADAGYRPANSLSATRVASTINNLPITVSAFTEAFIEDQKPYDLYDVVKWTPGVHQDNVSPQGWARYAVRGFTSASIQRNGFSSFRFIDTTNVARVEVVKGPASLLYGQINPGGVINYITKRPEKDAATRVSASVGSHGYNRFVLDSTGPMPGTGESLLLRGIAMAESIQSFHEGSVGDKFVLAPSAQWSLGDRLSVIAEYEHFERREDMLTSGVPLIYENGVATVPYPGLPWDFSYAGYGDYQDFISDALTIELKARLAEGLFIRASYLDSSWDMEWRATGQGATGLIQQSAIDAYYPPSSGLTPADAMFRRNRWERQQGGERSMQIDVTGTYDLGTVKLRPLIGAKRNLDTRFRGRQRNNAVPPGDPLYLRPWDLRNASTWDRTVPFGTDALIPVADTATSGSGLSYYGVLSLEAYDARLQVLAGYARHQVRNDVGHNYLAGTTTPAAERSQNIPQAGALYKFSREFSVFATYSESFLANSTMLRVDNVPTTPAAPSIGRGLEAGFKIELWEGRVSGTISAYAIDASPTGITIVTSGIDENGTTLFTDIQGGEQESNGLEFELLITPFPDLQMFASYGLCDAIYTEHPTNPALNGSRLVAAPEQTASLWGKYIFARQGSTEYTLTGGFNHVGEMAYVGNNPSVRLPAYTTVDLGFGCSFRLMNQPWSADLLVKNVSDVHYYAANTSWGFPRHVIMSLSTRF